uniref:Peptidoglycan D,D-transpeptidase FtsI n=1 Tax=Candidatus Kentrum sp. TUN TaxID=2126343 RepID=A0A450ZD15_9GAMM|nr:MAG: cell division protein FtsI (penicillin-binding protein 3) [Candidatus Kentron sp. TUN]VFK52309.1 MAG: cell division protein FtsI (penicillin-binding protein 3) [Candidatus Kentron sp. TUN]VFK52736.1 MAG: cell division protein FtsI (penicillin-binding protein 3) [Candidatus Kentron sp. TUN]
MISIENTSKPSSPIPTIRHWLVLGVMALVVGALLWRVGDLQLRHKEFLQTEGQARYMRVVKSPAHRGMILDRNKEPLAVSTPVESVWINPLVLAKTLTLGDTRANTNILASWNTFGKLFGWKEGHVQNLIAKYPNKQFMYVERHVSPDLVTRIKELDIEGVYLEREYRRYYPMGEVTAHVVGFTNVDDQGQEGMELVFDDWLRGTDGEKRVIQDRLGRFVEDVENIQSSQQGKNLILSIDQRIQYLAYRALLAGVRRHSAHSGSAVVLKVDTGEVLAMVNRPSYNPNNWSDRVSNRFRNRAVTDVLEPGSTIKPFTVAAALISGQFHSDTLLDTSPGFLKVGRHLVRDLRDYGLIDVATIIKKSSNVGATQLGLAVLPEAMWKVFSDIGFGEISTSGFPGEVSGLLPHFSDWGEIHQATLSFGYGLSVTSLQLANAYAVIASGGWLRPIRVQSGQQESSRVKRVLPMDVALQIRQMLESVTGPDGTGQRARIDGYRVAGKTGTVRKSTVGGYADDRYAATFAGFSPVSAPQLVVVVTVDEPSKDEYYGGQVAAPIFAKIMSGSLRLLGVPPDERSVRARRVVLTDNRVAFGKGSLPSDTFLPSLTSTSGVGSQ